MKRREMEAMINLAERMVLADKIDDMVRIAALRSLERTEIAPDETPSIEVTETEDDTPDGLDEMYAAWAAEAEEERRQLEEEDKIAEAYEHERQQQNRRRYGRKLKPGTEREQRIMDLLLEMDMRTGEIRLA